MQAMSLEHTMRLLVLFGVAIFIIVAEAMTAVSAVIVFGQAHFLLTYLYHFKSGKINQVYLLRYALVISALFGAYYWYGPSTWPNFLMYAYFGFHFLYDERYLMRESNSFDGWLRLLPLLIIFVACSFSAFMPQARAIALIILLLYVAHRFSKRKQIDSHELYFLLLFLVCILLTLMPHLPSVLQIINLIILVHYANWYLNYFFRFRSKPDSLRRFSLEVVLCNVILLIIFCVYIEYYAEAAVPNPALATLRYFFSGDYFALWTMMHLFVTFRPSDMGNWVPDTFKTQGVGARL